MGARPPVFSRQVATPLRSETLSLLARHGLLARKALGQHFLTDERVRQAILRTGEFGPEDVVLEIGPGLGTLTEGLLRAGSQVVAVEIDPGMVRVLTERFGGNPRLKVIQADILDYPFEEEVGPVYKAAGNLPYNIATAVLERVLSSRWPPRLSVVMLQLEVARRVAARPGEAAYLTWLVRFYAEPSIVMKVPPRAFWPPPKVYSAVVKLVRRDPPHVDSPEAFFKFLRAGFTQPRKQLRNSLADGLRRPPTEMAAILERAGIDPRRRPADLDLEEWLKIYRVYREYGFAQPGPGEG